MSSFVSPLHPPRTPQPSPELQHRNEPSQDSPESPSSSSWAIDPLDPLQRRGLIAVSSLATISLIATFSLIVFLTYRLIFWRRHYQRYIGHNQYLVLIYNLALADFQQGLGFIISLRWIATNSIHASDAACFIQGIMLQIGDPMSGMFVLAIAVYTFLHIILDYKISHPVFVAGVVGLWVFGVVMVIIPIAVVGPHVWLPAVAWCWIPVEHHALRLWTHYFWIFAVQFLTVLLYIIMFIHLRRRIAECVALGGRNTKSLRRLNRVVGYMVLYPVLYIALTLPLAAGRMESATGHPPSVLYFCIAGSLMTLSGACDTILYTLTRTNAVLDPEGNAAVSDPGSSLARGGRKEGRTESNINHNDTVPSIAGQGRDSNAQSVANDAKIEQAAKNRISLDEMLNTIPDPSHPAVESGSSTDARNASRESFGCRT